MIAVTDQLLDILKYALLGLLYLFFARVLWAVWSEVRGPRQGKARAAEVPVAQQSYSGGTPAAATGQLDLTAATALPQQAAVTTAPRGRAAKKAAVGELVITQPRVRRGASFQLGQEITIGRSDSCTVTIPDDSFVSQLHARVYLLHGAAVAEDLGSTNGTYVNGKRLTAPTQIVKGDRLQVGNTIFEAK
ncbi:MAG: FHA domain-containing protein [Ilumatobacteraceae bacterium]